MSAWVSLRKKIGGFGKEDHGSATIEAVIWMPVFVLILCLVADASLIFSKQAQVLRIVQDANRAYSVGRIMTTADAEAFILARIGELSPHATVRSTLQSGVIVSTVTMPSSDLTATSFVSPFSALNVTVTAQHMSEA